MEGRLAGSVPKRPATNSGGLERNSHQLREAISRADHAFVVEVKNIGARGYVSTFRASEVLVDAIEAAARGEDSQWSIDISSFPGFRSKEQFHLANRSQAFFRGLAGFGTRPDMETGSKVTIATLATSCPAIPSEAKTTVSFLR